MSTRHKPSPDHPRADIGPAGTPDTDSVTANDDARAPLNHPPGQLVIPADAAPPRLTLLAYGAQGFEESPVTDLAAVAARRGHFPILWLNVDGLGDADLLGRIGTMFNIHPLALEDVANRHERPKADVYPHGLLIVLRMLRRSEDRFISEQISIVLGPDFVVTFQEVPGDCLGPLRDRLRQGRGRVRTQGADYLAYAILDAIVDGYYPALERIGDRIDLLEDHILTAPGQDLVKAIQAVRRELLGLRRVVWPVREMLNHLLRDAASHFAPDTILFLRDCYDHTIQVMDVLETQRELSAGLMESYMSSVSNRMNEIMKVLTIFAAIFIPLTFLAGIYGMNFDPALSPWNMPELRARYGYPATLFGMLVVALGMLSYFYRRGWLGSNQARRAARRALIERPRAPRRWHELTRG
ncbi:MAG: magnesium/cobalt transporter CorA [Candidatus Marinimicrobia bacterium]|nr:magnesium/cobalt transporter CorA [Candidatus Neomarinimicrobiota bacterium]